MINEIQTGLEIYLDSDISTGTPGEMKIGTSTKVGISQAQNAQGTEEVLTNGHVIKSDCYWVIIHVRSQLRSCQQD